MTGHNAAIMTFGNYNRELFDQYGLFGYRGFNGMSVKRWQEEYIQNMNLGLVSIPTNRMLSQYSNLYRIQQVEAKHISSHTLGEEQAFLHAIKKECIALGLKRAAPIRALGQNQINNKENLNQSLEQEEQLENGKYHENQKETEQTPKPVSQEEVNNQLKKDHAGGNPITFFQKLFQGGILGLVSDTEKLSKEEIDGSRPRINGNTNLERKETTYPSNWMNPSSTQKESTAGILKKIINGDSLFEGIIKTEKEKAELIAYVNHYFSCKTHPVRTSKRYAIEYLIGGKKSDQESLYQVVLRILMFRIFVNYSYIAKDATWNTESLATATVIAGLLSCEPLINQLQKLIQLIGAFEEACIDVTALLENKEVPLRKDSSNFQLQYQEICLGSRTLFQKKAQKYTKCAEHTKGILQGMIGYADYLQFFLWQQNKTSLVERSLDFIQDDLRKTKNQSFEINACLTEVEVETTYLMPLFSGVFGLSQPDVYLSEQRKERGKMKNNIKIKYGYQ